MIFDCITALLYIITAIATWNQVWPGRFANPLWPLPYAVFCGAFLLLVSAALTRWRPRIARNAAVVAAILLWLFYAPALYGLRNYPWIDRRFFVALVPADLLFVATVCAAGGDCGRVNEELSKPQIRTAGESLR